MNGWPVRDTHLGYLTHLQLLSLDLSNCWLLTSACLLHEMPLFTTLSCLYLGQDNYWYTVPDLEACERLRHDVIPILRVLST